MKFGNWVVPAFALLVIGCKENHNLVTLSSATSAASDTTYVLPTGSIPAAQPHNILIEDFTGVSCSNCPAAHDEVLLPLLAANPGRINVMEMFVTDFPQTSPNVGETYGGFRDTVATTIENTIFGSLALMPIAGIDRLPDGPYGLNNVQITKGLWNTVATTRLATADSLNLTVTSTYSAATATATIVANVTYLQSVSTLQNLSIAVVEDSFTDLQEFPDSVALYQYNGVFRSLVTAVPFGDPIYPTIPSKEPGRVCQFVYSYALNPAWKPNHCRIIAFVTGSGAVAGQPVYQSCSVPLAP